MATQETQKLDEIISNRRALMIGGGALAALALAGQTAKAQSTITDNDILNFALNLEYLEANFYYAAAFGTTIDKAVTPIAISGVGGAGVTATVKANPKVPFTSIAVSSYAIETALEEGKHVTLLRGALGTLAVAQPQIDLQTSFNTLASAAGIGSTFDPFLNDANFLIGAYVFEDVGVTAYHGAAGLISSTSILGTAAGILAVEAYHAGLIRTTINAFDPLNTLGYQTLTQKISSLRAKLSGAAAVPVVATANDDFGLGTQTVSLEGTSVTASTLLDADANAIAFSRTTSQVLSIVTGGGAGNKGVFFPAGLNGTIK